MVTKADAGSDEVETLTTWVPSDPTYFIDSPRAFSPASDLACGRSCPAAGRWCRGGGGDDAVAGGPQVREAGGRWSRRRVRPPRASGHGQHCGAAMRGRYLCIDEGGLSIHWRSSSQHIPHHTPAGFLAHPLCGLAVTATSETALTLP